MLLNPVGSFSKSSCPLFWKSRLRNRPRAELCPPCLPDHLPIHLSSLCSGYSTVYKPPGSHTL